MPHMVVRALQAVQLADYQLMEFSHHCINDEVVRDLSIISKTHSHHWPSYSLHSSNLKHYAM